MKILLSIWKKSSFVILLAFVVLGFFDLRCAVIAVVCMIGPVITAVYKGRFWCGNICPRGCFFDVVISKFSNTKKSPRIFKSFIFRIIVLVLVMSAFISGISKNWGNPYGIGRIFYRMIIITTTIGIVLSIFYNHRIWCNFCPMGTLSSAISALSKNKKVLHVENFCISCGICEKQCPFGLKPYQYKGGVLDNSDCLQCGRCAASCPKKAIGYKKSEG